MISLDHRFCYADNPLHVDHLYLCWLVCFSLAQCSEYRKQDSDIYGRRIWHHDSSTAQWSSDKNTLLSSFFFLYDRRPVLPIWHTAMPNLSELVEQLNHRGITRLAPRRILLSNPFSLSTQRKSLTTTFMYTNCNTLTTLSMLITTFYVVNDIRDLRLTNHIRQVTSIKFKLRCDVNP